MAYTPAQTKTTETRCKASLPVLGCRSNSLVEFHRLFLPLDQNSLGTGGGQEISLKNLERGGKKLNPVES